MWVINNEDVAINMKHTQRLWVEQNDDTGKWMLCAELDSSRPEYLYDVLGEYKSESTALERLHEIMDAIKAKWFFLE